MIRVTASKAGLLAECRYWARPEAEWATSTSPAADRGQRFHRAIAHYITTGESSACEPDIADLVVAAAAWVDHYGREHLRAEIAYGWDPTTDAVTELVLESERAYPSGPLCGTVDIVAVSRATRSALVADWKTGDASNAGPQLRALGMMVARAYGLDSVTVVALQVEATGVREVGREELDDFAVAAVAADLAALLDMVPGAEPRPGAHCRERWCPARLRCPAADEQLPYLVPAAALTRKVTDEITTADHAAWALDIVRLIEAKCEAIRDGIKAKCPERGWELPDGSRLIETTKDMSRFDKARAITLLRELGASEEQIATLEYRCRVSNGLRLLKAKAPRKRDAA